MTTGVRRLDTGVYEYKGCVIRRELRGRHRGQWAIYDQWQGEQYLDLPHKRPGYYPIRQEAIRAVNREPGGWQPNEKAAPALDSAEVGHRILTRHVPSPVYPTLYSDTEYYFADKGPGTALVTTYTCTVQLRGEATNEEWAELINHYVNDVWQPLL